MLSQLGGVQATSHCPKLEIADQDELESAEKKHKAAAKEWQAPTSEKNPLENRGRKNI